MVLIKAWIVILIIELFEVLLILALERFDSLLPVAVIDGEEVVWSDFYNPKKIVPRDIIVLVCSGKLNLKTL